MLSRRWHGVMEKWWSLESRKEASPCQGDESYTGMFLKVIARNGAQTMGRQETDRKPLRRVEDPPGVEER